MDSPGSGPAPTGSIPIPPYPSATADALVRSSPPRPHPSSTDRLRGELTRLDGVLVAIVLIFAFFLASFTATNSDVWMHLATGRLIAEGNYAFGTDPFSFTTADVRWVNHAWLPDWLAYLISSAFGGPEEAMAGGTLVLLKGLTVVALAVVMLLMCRRRGALWPAAVGVALGLLAMSPRLLLQPRCMSFLFLGVTLYLLTRARSRIRIVGIPILFAVWVNVDEWFILGPVTVALVLIGELIQSSSGKTESQVKSLAVTLVLGLGACLLNPYHVHAFQLPPELWAWLQADAVPNDPLATPLIERALRWGYVYRKGFGVIPAGLAYYALLALGLASFLMVRDRWPWWRGLVWATFAALSLRLERAAPFFAVAGTTVTILNWQDFFAIRTFAIGSGAALLGRVATIIATLALVVLAWPGWLSNEPLNVNLGHYPRRVSWAIHVDPSLKAASEKIARLRADNVIGDTGHGFNFSRDMANYWAWFCPSEKGFIDYRFSLFRNVAVAYGELREALRTRPKGEATEVIDWPAEFREHGIDHLVVGNTEREGFDLMRSFWSNPETWAWLYGDGRTCIFGWRDPENAVAGERFQRNVLNTSQEAFGPKVPAEDCAPETAPPPPQLRPYWETFALAGLPRPLAADESAMYQAYFETIARRREQNVGRTLSLYFLFRSLFANTDTVLAAPSGVTIFRLGIAPFWTSVPPQILVAQLQGRDRGPAAALTLSVRAARRAAAVNPNDAATYEAIATAYLSLWQQQEARWLGGQRGSLLHRLRLVQSITAMRNLQVLKPDDPSVLRSLALAYEQMDLASMLSGAPIRIAPGPPVDLELWHWRESLRLVREKGPQPILTPEGERRPTQEEFNTALSQEERQIQDREQRYNMDRRRDEYEVAAGGKGAIERAVRALEFGLVKESLDEFRKADLTGQPPQVLDLIRRLYLVTGQTFVALEAERPFLDTWDDVLAAAAIGDYHNADIYLEQKLRQVEDGAVNYLMNAVRDQTISPRLTPSLGHRVLTTFQMSLQFLDTLSQLEVIRGVLALEVGDTDKALRSFQRSLQYGVPPSYRAFVLTPLAAGSTLEAATLWTAASKQPATSSILLSTQDVALRYWQLLHAARSN